MFVDELTHSHSESIGLETHKKILLYVFVHFRHVHDPSFKVHGKTKF